MEKKKILIADDEERIVKLVSDFLNASGYETVCAADGKEALDIFNADSGIDLASVDRLDGIPIRAVAAGTIFSSNFSPSYGNNIIIKHDIDTNYSIYCHLKERIKKDGELVKKGEIIGYMGSTGSAERSELHLQINSFIDGDYKNGAENPLKYFPKLADKLGRSSLA